MNEDTEFLQRGMAVVQIILERNNARAVLRDLISDVRALAPAFQFTLPASVYYAEALLDGISDWQEEGKRRALIGAAQNRTPD
jgi:hypothetical protein